MVVTIDHSHKAPVKLNFSFFFLFCFGTFEFVSIIVFNYSVHEVRADFPNMTFIAT